MQISKVVLALAVLGALSACGNTDTERALTGGLIGGGVAAATDNNLAAGAAVGAAAGALCDDANVCQ